MRTLLLKGRSKRGVLVEVPVKAPSMVDEAPKGKSFPSGAVDANRNLLMNTKFLYQKQSPSPTPETPRSEANSPDKISLEQRLKQISSKVKCPLANGKLYLSVIIGDASKKRQIVVDCPAKAAQTRRSGDKRVHQAYVEEVCCSPQYSQTCDYFQKFFNR